MSEIKSAPLVSKTTRGKESAITSRARLRRQRGAIERYTAYVVLFVSFLGTVVALAGGWEPFIMSLLAWRPNVAALGGGIGLQALLTYLQWHYFDHKPISWTARLMDAALTAIGWGPLFAPWLNLQLAARAVPEPLYVAWVILGLVALAVAWYPESRLVE